ncbi:MAG: penicillin-binding protein activator [gamma proteobacterium symbiont of Taylorina sp.]|nr:penicillin-binding protein activator [gamma proteobacterium symbiont of Taylorina sp.]
MSKLYQFIIILPILVLLMSCGGTIDKKKETAIIDKTVGDVALLDDTVISSMNNNEKIQYAERLFAASLSKGSSKNALLDNALYLCSEVLLSSELTAEERDYTLQLSKKIFSQIDRISLSKEQSNQLTLTSASEAVVRHQFSQAIQLLNQDFNTTLSTQWSLYHKIIAISYYQQGQKSNAIHELIFRQNYLPENAKLENQTLIWIYLHSLNTLEIKQSREYFERMSLENAGLTENQQIYVGWLDLAAVFQQGNDPQMIHNSTSFWLQNYPHHPADRAFINYIIQRRQESILHISHIAVLLPMQGKLAKPAKAIRNGIMASHYSSPLLDNIQLRFYDTSGTQSITLHKQAVDDGAEFIIGPLTKTNVQLLLQSSLPEIPTLALNSIEETIEAEGILKSQHLFQFGLSPESEARMVAKKGYQDGHKYAVVMVPDNLWGQRMQTAFTQSWQQDEGIVVETASYPPEEYDFSESIKSLLKIEQSESRKKLLSRTIGRKLEFTPRRRQDIDMLFMAAFPKQARQIPLQITYHHGETIPIYSTARIIADYYNTRLNIDIDGVIFSDMPFLLDIKPDAVSTQSGLQTILYERLFAMGADSYQVAPYINFLAENPAESFTGDTGELSINHQNQIIRSLPWASFSQGEIKVQEAFLPDSNSDTDFDDAALY